MNLAIPKVALVVLGCVLAVSCSAASATGPDSAVNTKSQRPNTTPLLMVAFGDSLSVRINLKIDVLQQCGTEVWKHSNSGWPPLLRQVGSIMSAA